LLGQFRRNPKALSFKPPIKGGEKIGGTQKTSVQMPVALPFVCLMLDLKCKCFTALIDDYGAAIDVASFLRLSEKWLEVGVFGGAVQINGPKGDAAPVNHPPQLSLGRISQGLRFAGHPKRALMVVEKALQI